MKHSRLWMVILVLVGAGLACALPGGAQPPASPIPVSTEAAGQLREVVKTAAANAVETGTLDLTLTEEQITSFVALQLAEQPDAPIQDLQVFLRDDKIQIFGTVSAGGVTAQAQIILSAVVGTDGTLALSVDKADFGPVPVPASLLEQISTTMDEALTQQAGSNFVLTSVTIAEGQIHLQGSKP